MISVIVTLTTAGSDTGPFNLFSNVNGYTSAFETNVDKLDLLAGYTSSVVPDGTTIIRVMSEGVCKNYTDITIVTTTTTTTSITPTTTTTTSTPIIIGRGVTIPVPVEPSANLIISYTDPTGFFVSGQTIPAQISPTNYFLCIECATTITVDSGTPNGSITYDTGIGCNCA